MEGNTPHSAGAPGPHLPAKEVIRLVEFDFIEKALDVLAEWVAAFKNSDLDNQLSALKARYSNLSSSSIKGTLGNDEIILERNRIRSDILEFCKLLEKLGPPPPAANQSGVIAHNIPGEMKMGLVHQCTVRIAQEEFVLLKDFSPAAPVESLRISDEMEVELNDITGNAFEIKTYNRKTQTILEGEATEWVFYVKPLLTGTHILQLKAAMKMIGPDGREKIKEYTYENNISVETTQEASAEPVVSEKWHALSDAFNIFKKKKKSGLFAWLSSPVAAKAVFATLAVLIAAAGILYYPMFFPPSKKEKDEKKRVDVRLDIQLLRRPFTVFLNGDSISNWQPDGAGAGINLPGIAEGTYLVKVQGSNGSCSDSIFPSTERTVFSLPCTIIPDSFSVRLTAPFENFRIFVDNVRVRTTGPVLRAGAGRFKTSLRVAAGNRVFRVEDRNGNFRCSEMRTRVDADKELNFNCNPVVRYYDVGIISPFQRPMVKIDGETASTDRTATEAPAGWKLVFRVKEGTRQFEVIDPRGGHACLVQTREVNSNQDIRFTCRPKTTTVTINLTGVNVAAGRENTWLSIDGARVDRNRVRMNVTLLNKEEQMLTLVVTGVPYGRHTFKVEKEYYSSQPESCSSASVEISEQNRTVVISCSFTKRIM